MEIQGNPKIRNHMGRLEARPGKALDLEVSTSPVVLGDAATRAVGQVLGQVIDLLDSLETGLAANRAARKAPAADMRLAAGGAAVLADLVAHTRAGDEFPLIEGRPANPRLQVYGVATPASANRAWIAAAREKIGDLRAFLERVSSRGVGESEMRSLADWKREFTALNVARSNSMPLDLTA